MSFANMNVRVLTENDNLHGRWWTCVEGGEDVIDGWKHLWCGRVESSDDVIPVWFGEFGSETVTPFGREE